MRPLATSGSPMRRHPRRPWACRPRGARVSRHVRPRGRRRSPSRRRRLGRPRRLNAVSAAEEAPAADPAPGADPFEARRASEAQSLCSQPVEWPSSTADQHHAWSGPAAAAAEQTANADICTDASPTGRPQRCTLAINEAASLATTLANTRPADIPRIPNGRRPRHHPQEVAEPPQKASRPSRNRSRPSSLSPPKGRGCPSLSAPRGEPRSERNRRPRCPDRAPLS